MNHSPQIVEMMRTRRAASAKQGVRTRRHTLSNKRPIRIALYHIASTSPYHQRSVYEKEEALERPYSTTMASSWSLPECEFLWAIYERAVYDYFRVGLGNGKYDGATISPNDTAVRGVIDLPNGGQRNILELLGLDPQWCWAQIQKAINYTQRKEAA